MSSAYLKLLIFLLAILIPFPVLNQSIVPCLVLTVASWPAYRFLRRQVSGVVFPSLYKNFPKFVVIHTVKGFGIVNKVEVDVFLELSCFYCHPLDAGNLIPGSSAFSKFSLNIWEFLVHILLKPNLGNSEHYFTSMWNESHCVIDWTFFGIAPFGDWNELTFWVQPFHRIVF